MPDAPDSTLAGVISYALQAKTARGWNALRPLN